MRQLLHKVHFKNFQGNNLEVFCINTKHSNIFVALQAGGIKGARQEVIINKVFTLAI